MRLRLILACLAVAAYAAPHAALADEALHGDPAAGEHIYKTVCSLCHSNQKGQIKIGPPLFGAYGRKAASFAGFHYSDALAASGKTWDYDTLFQWEGGARKYIPGTKMSFPGLKTDKEKNDIIAYLQTLHD